MKKKRMLLHDIEHLDKVLFVMAPADIGDVVKVIDDYLLMLVKELENVIVVVIERVSVDLGFGAKLSDRNVGQFFSLDKFFQRFQKSGLCSDNPYVSCSLHIPYLTYKIDIINIPL